MENIDGKTSCVPEINIDEDTYHKIIRGTYIQSSSIEIVKEIVNKIILDFTLILNAQGMPEEWTDMQSLNEHAINCVRDYIRIMGEQYYKR